MAKTWRHLASSYQFVESLERFLLVADKRKSGRPSDPPMEREAPIFPPPGAAFDPDNIAVLTVAYNKAIEGQSPFAREFIAKRIFELAFEGERDPDKLSKGAFALPCKPSP